ncbi:NmrA family NAD(P)-binding protein [Streptomyces sp. NBC_00063]|uniref:NmrA family NAD(P)-binding protein n=1 Tax=Streptomyces sp. NBC_00063 TaxID=2975638 RepID=UPI003D72C6F8
MFGSDSPPSGPFAPLITAASPEISVALVAADDLGAAVAAAVVGPRKFHGAEIQLAGDELTFSEIAATSPRLRTAKSSPPP